ncbi:MAG: MBL fold metallo-hydrolase [Candidatus Woesearchaeota archaeon]
MKITKYTQSCFLIETEGKKLLIDAGNMVSEEVISSFRNIDFLLFTHTHNDHCNLETTNKILDNNNPIIIGNEEIAKKLSNLNVVIMKEGKINIYEDIKIEMTKAIHGYYFAMKDAPLPKPNGFIVKDTKISVYHCSDSIAFYNDYQADVILVPICGHSIVMEPDIAVEFCLEINAKLAIPMHYDNNRHPQGTEKFEKFANKMSLNYKVLKDGESIEI